ncbi:hypothetical protein HMPREF1243_1715 [Streptococcus pyogenes GA03747]|nr:hypothetical protein HMPREF1243_1715 [Streptococcus pyogenes GA03747]CCG26713.1 FIG01116766: hypothetical protein [Streptococcus pyogenes NS88.2]
MTKFKKLFISGIALLFIKALSQSISIKKNLKNNDFKSGYLTGNP